MDEVTPKLIVWKKNVDRQKTKNKKPSERDEMQEFCQANESECCKFYRIK